MRRCNETGADVVEDAIDDGATISAVSLSEVLAKMVDAGTTADGAADLIVSLFVEVAPFGLESARDTARTRQASRPAGLSLGDSACLSLGRRRIRPVITADLAWLGSSASLGVEVRSIRCSREHAEGRVEDRPRCFARRRERDWRRR